ncbi:hypothetical protein ACVRYP_08420 [Streptococcus rifensis]
MKKIILVLGLLSFIFLGGIVMIFGFGDSILEQKERTVQKQSELTLTKEQQDNVVRWIVRGYDPITQVEFTEFSKDKKTGTYYLLFQLNNDDNLKTGLAISTISEFDDSTGNIGMSPIENFKFLERDIEIPSNESVDISTVQIIYLGD